MFASLFSCAIKLRPIKSVFPAIPFICDRKHWNESLFLEERSPFLRFILRFAFSICTQLSATTTRKKSFRFEAESHAKQLSVRTRLWKNNRAIEWKSLKQTAVERYFKLIDHFGSDRL